MTTMKKAKVTPAAFDVTCPHCGESIAEPAHGSLVWEASQVASSAVVTCFACGQQSAIPKARAAR